ncbi:MAG: C1 family peptidase [Candidatus Ratteibacteria bacterium]
MTNILSKYGMGWIPDYPDIRDYTQDTKEIKETFGRIRQKIKNALPEKIDLRQWCSPVDNQGSLGSCTANAGVGMIEYYEMRAFGKFIKASRLFLYKTTRNLMKMKGDTGAFLRTTMGAMVLFGVPPEDYWQYTDDKERFDIEPPAFCYAFAQNYQTIKYFRHDVSGISRDDLLKQIKSYLVSGHPSMFGFSVYTSIREAEKTGKIPFPSQKEKVLGGHAIMTVGYDDKIKIKNPYSGNETIGALLIRNSWGDTWGEEGYGWLPYEYVLTGLAQDFWSILKKEWIDTAQFE